MSFSMILTYQKFPDSFSRRTMDFQWTNLFKPEYRFMKTTEINLVRFNLFKLA